jgi:hypothetical protein
MNEHLTLERQIRDIKDMMVGQLRRTGRRSDPADRAIIRAATVRLVSFARRQTIEDIAAQLYRDNGDVERAIENPSRFLQRAATSPAMTGVSGWASELVATNYAGLLASLSPQSVYAQLSARGLRIDAKALTRLPNRAAPNPAPSPFVGESQPIPVRALALSGAMLVPFKAAIISHFTSEIAKQSTPSIETTLRTTLAEDIRAGIDGVLLSTAAGTPSAPAGLLNGVTPIAGSANPATDLSKLANALDPPAVDPVYIMSSSDAQTLRLTLPGAASLSIVETDALAAGTVVLVDASDFASCTGDDAAIDIVDDATIISDTEPLPVATGVSGSAAITAAPHTSLWQMNMLGIRCIEFVGWTLRRPGRVRLLTGATW